MTAGRWWVHNGVLVVDPHETTSPPPEQRVGVRRDLAERVFSPESLAAIRRERARNPICPAYGVVARTCPACAGRGCTEALRAELAGKP